MQSRPLGGVDLSKELVVAGTFKFTSRDLVYIVSHIEVMLNILQIIDSRDALDVVPLYLRYNDPMCAPILSQNSPTSNVLLKITVPKRTGRKRKRGSQDPYQGDAVTVPRKEGEVIPPLIMSHSRLDNPAGLLRRLQETSGLYDVEVVGEITQSHRFRGKSNVLPFL